MPNNSNDKFTFKGQVKVTDIQAAFDELIERINSIVDTYNETDTFLQEQDYSVGGDSLGAAGYTLTIGGIKQVLAAYDGTLLGCRAFRLDANTVIITDGVYIKSTGAINIPSQVLTGTGTVIYLDSNNNVVLGNDGDNMPSGATLLVTLSQTKDDVYLNCHRRVQLEGLPGYSITINNRRMAHGVEPDDNTFHRFQGAGVFYVNSGGADVITYQGLDIISYGVDRNQRGMAGYRRHSSADPANFLFIPKGCNSPIYVQGRNHTERSTYFININEGTV